MGWIYLIVAGLFEIAWAIGLKQSEGFTRLWPTLWFIATSIISFYLLALALRTLPIGTAYAVWTGIGAAGTAIIGMIVFSEPRDVLRIVSIVLIIAGVFGLRLAHGGGTPA